MNIEVIRYRFPGTPCGKIGFSLAVRAMTSLHFGWTYAPLSGCENIDSSGRRDTAQNFQGHCRRQTYELRRNRFHARGHSRNRVPPSQDSQRSWADRLPPPRAVRLQPGRPGSHRSLLAGPRENSAQQERPAVSLMRKKDFRAWGTPALPGVQRLTARYVSPLFRCFFAKPYPFLIAGLASICCFRDTHLLSFVPFTFRPHLTEG